MSELFEIQSPHELTIKISHEATSSLFSGEIFVVPIKVDDIYKSLEYMLENNLIKLKPAITYRRGRDSSDDHFVVEPIYDCASDKLGPQVLIKYVENK